MKKRSGRNFIRFFYHLLVVLVMAMPLLSGLVRIIYVQSNQNAFESYSGTTYKVVQPVYYSSNDIVNSDDIVFGNIYTLTINNSYIGGDSQVLSEFYYIISYDYQSTTYDGTSTNNIYFYGSANNSNTAMRIYYDNNGTSVYSNYLDYTIDLVINDGININLLVPYLSKCSRTYLKGYYEVTQTETLDNAFDYSIWKTMQEFTFHSDFRFTDIANGMLMSFDNNNLYIQYINFYINWVLTCAVISFAPYVLLSFYHLSIGLLDKFMKKGEDL